MFLFNEIHFGIGGRVLLDHVTWQVNALDRVALIGGNGAGKSTLMRIIAGIVEPDTGSIHAPKGSTFGYLPQDGLHFNERALFEEARSVFAHILSAEDELRSIEHELESLPQEDPNYESTLARYDHLLERFQQWDGYRIDAEIGRVLEGLGFSELDWEKPCDQFSGGWQMRIALAKLLLERPSMLLLDEPTNHLDLEARHWLQEYLADYPSAVLLVSHDRHFLDVVVKRCTELFQGKLTDYHGNFSYYEVERERRYEALEESARRQSEEIEKIERFIERFRYKSSKATQVQSRVKQLEKIERIVLPPKPPKVKFSFPAPPRSGKVVLELNKICKTYGDNKVLEDLDLVLERGERVALLGVNGAGKSTLMRIIAGVDDYEGERIVGYQAELGFFAQDQRAVLDPSHTILQSLESTAPIDVVPRLRTLLGAFLFSGDDVYKKVSVLSGGERSRLAIARLLLQPYNLLLLDEPTNHLDIQAQEILLNALQSFQGTILFVSHDRHLIDALATNVIEVRNGKAERFLGNYADYLAAKARRGEEVSAADGVQWTTQHKASDGSARPPAMQAERASRPSSSANQGEADERLQRQQNYQELQAQKRELAKQERQLRKLVEDQEATLATQEEELQTIEELMASAGFYDDFEKASVATERYTALKQAIEEGYEAWETHSLALADLLASMPEDT